MNKPDLALNMYKPDLALNNLQWLICDKTKPNQLKYADCIHCTVVISIKKKNVLDVLLSGKNT